MNVLLSVLAVLDLPTPIDVHFVLAGHGYDTGSSPRDPSRGGVDDEGGISMVWIVAVLVVTLVAVGALLGLDPSGAKAKLRALAPAALPAAVIALPLIVWAVSAGGDENGLIVERATASTGAPELIVSVADDDLSRPETSGHITAVRVECRDREGNVVLAARQRWPFVTEGGYEHPHVHQRATREQIQRIARCRLGGMSVRLEADVQGPLTG